jgi:hypothetical protein
MNRTGRLSGRPTSLDSKWRMFLLLIVQHIPQKTMSSNVRTRDPYSLEINDSVIYAVEKHSSSEMHDRLVHSLATFESELAKGPRILTLRLHPHLIAVPHRFIWFERMLDLLMARGDVSFMTGSQIADWFESVSDPAEKDRTAAYEVKMR